MACACRPASTNAELAALARTPAIAALLLTHADRSTNWWRCVKKREDTGTKWCVKNHISCTSFPFLVPHDWWRAGLCERGSNTRRTIRGTPDNTGLTLLFGFLLIFNCFFLNKSYNKNGAMLDLKSHWPSMQQLHLRLPRQPLHQSLVQPALPLSC